MLVPMLEAVRRAVRSARFVLPAAVAIVAGAWIAHAQVVKSTAPAPAPASPPAPPAEPGPTPLSTMGGSTLYSTTAGFSKAKGRPTPRRTIKAHVVALDQPYMWNRLGSSQPNAMVYALARDVVPTNYDPTKHAAPPDFSTYVPGQVRLREDRRPRPLVLRANEGDLLVVTFTNLLQPAPPNSLAALTRYAGFQAMGLELYDGIQSDSSWVGTNPGVNPTAKQPKTGPTPANQGGVPGSLCAPGETKVYKLFARAEGTYLVHSFSADTPLANQTSQLQSGLFGVINVQPEGPNTTAARWSARTSTSPPTTCGTARSSG